jgi:hypothetical protein
MGEDAEVAWLQLALLVFLCWIGTAFLVGTFVGHAIAFGAPDHS